ncbi:hypothetical protein BX661DRAFT_190308 [Kickxella alabastrina]|uniref:uncharacterized protein n=1 Tax=Kickxella alabastrina TaxID=61397 RepID=UPI00221F6FBB|nr:uncharacterized protein BX661DRAFT_190308 [Kickxella alabastrina]KAI7819467.1 hypothetical protein BX661DRAFT_190308 [Kickxella alabastrina]
MYSGGEAFLLWGTPSASLLSLLLSLSLLLPLSASPEPFLDHTVLSALILFLCVLEGESSNTIIETPSVRMIPLNLCSFLSF